ncbi:MAG TPA: FHA domain-containing protein [Casimicrobiaceae bacterium]|jgi:pSer/pThr/pTyr-binding forkhead associated (FHA) protein|nr:FHA domain-containing protein [Casimicrobiaceae bacterium]
MAKLVLSSEGSILFQCFVDTEPLSVGSAAHNQVVIDDAAVSEEHAVIVPVGNDHILEDLQSTQGTVVNGTRVERRILQHGDVMQFGAFYLRYLNPRASAERDLERTMLIAGLQDRATDAQPDAMPVEAADGTRSVRQSRTHFPKGRVRVIAGSRAGSTIELDRVVATFGRPGDQLAVITRRPHGYFITHVEGRRFPRVNGATLGKEAQVLRHGDVIDVADEELEFGLD